MNSAESGLQQSLGHFKYAGCYCLQGKDKDIKIYALSQLRCQ